ncbi:phosphatase PAP2 family protein [Staphylococcus hominis]|uniref:phosphatase PAP2 family protein n=1 Tax=Staphylococcus hominis TaxID=1290 RepID=UPI003CFCAAA4
MRNKKLFNFLNIILKEAPRGGRSPPPLWPCRSATWSAWTFTGEDRRWRTCPRAAASRLRTRVHWPTDVLGGLAIGALVALAQAGMAFGEDWAWRSARARTGAVQHHGTRQGCRHPWSVRSWLACGPIRDIPPSTTNDAPVT